MYILNDYEKKQVDTLLRGVALDVALILSKSPIKTITLTNKRFVSDVDVIKTSDNNISTIVNGETTLFSVRPLKGLGKSTLSDVSICVGEYRNKLSFIEAYLDDVRDNLMSEKQITGYQKRIGVR